MGLVPLLIQVLQGYIEVLLNPLVYVSIFLVYWQYRRLNSLERGIFGIRVTRAGTNTIRSTLAGICAGVVGTLLLAGLGVILSPTDLLIVWILAVVLMTVRTRYICFAYGGGLLSIVALLLGVAPAPVGPHWVIAIWSDVRHAAVPQLLALIAVLHLMEAALLYAQAGEDASPTFFQGRRGRPIGGFLLQRFWMVPLVVFVATGQPGMNFAAPSWWTLIPLGVLSAGVQLSGIPAVLGFSGVVTAGHPKTRARQMAGWLALYSLILFVLVIVGIGIPIFIVIAALFAPIAHEAIILWESRYERSRNPRFVPPARGGVRVLSMLPGSPARAAGVKSGEVIVRVNSMPVSSPYDVHFAINLNPAYVRLDVFDESGELRVLGTALYEGAHHLLGLILVPDSNVRKVAEFDPPLLQRVAHIALRNKATKSDT